MDREEPMTALEFAEWTSDMLEQAPQHRLAPDAEKVAFCEPKMRTSCNGSEEYYVEIHMQNGQRWRIIVEEIK